MPYDIKKFRTIRHGLDEVNAHCRQCDWSEHDGDVARKAKIHARRTLHTVDVYRIHRTEYTSYVKEV